MCPRRTGEWQARLEPLEAAVLGHGALALHQARTFGDRRRGLARLESLPADVGLHIHRCSAVHTVGMRFALDLVWLGRGGEVLRVDRDVRPRRQKLCLRAKSVIEVAAGGADRWVGALGVEEGSR
jgi:uncharacterized membrane protein (UPF0127 family)